MAYSSLEEAMLKSRMLLALLLPSFGWWDRNLAGRTGEPSLCCPEISPTIGSVYSVVDEHFRLAEAATAKGRQEASPGYR